MSVGYDRPLYILPFDHRGSFQTGLFGWKGALSAEQTSRVAEPSYDARPADGPAWLMDAQGQVHVRRAGAAAPWEPVATRQVSVSATDPSHPWVTNN